MIIVQQNLPGNDEGIPQIYIVTEFDFIRGVICMYLK